MNSNVFVFGSNLAGRHGAGAARAAVLKHGAIYGQGIGLQGNSYGIPTKDHYVQTLPLPCIQSHVSDFLSFAKEHKELLFNVTRIGCGLAGYTDWQIAPMFKDASSNVYVPIEWEEFVKETKHSYIYWNLN